MPVPGSPSKAILSMKHSPPISSDNVPRAGSVSHQMLPAWHAQSSDGWWWAKSVLSLCPKHCPERFEMEDVFVFMLCTGLRSTAHPLYHYVFSKSTGWRRSKWLLKQHVGDFLSMWNISSLLPCLQVCLYISHFPLQLFIFICQNK